MMRMRLRCLLPTEMRNWIDCLTAPLVSETPSKHSQASSSSASLGWAGGWSLWIEHLDPPSPSIHHRPAIPVRVRHYAPADQLNMPTYQPPRWQPPRKHGLQLPLSRDQLGGIIVYPPLTAVRAACLVCAFGVLQCVMCGWGEERSTD